MKGCGNAAKGTMLYGTGRKTLLTSSCIGSELAPAILARAGIYFFPTFDEAGGVGAVMRSTYPL